MRSRVHEPLRLSLVAANEEVRHVSGPASCIRTGLPARAMTPENGCGPLIRRSAGYPGVTARMPMRRGTS